MYNIRQVCSFIIPDDSENNTTSGQEQSSPDSSDVASSPRSQHSFNARHITPKSNNKGASSGQPLQRQRSTATGTPICFPEL